MQKRQHIVFGPNGLIGCSLLRKLRSRFGSELLFTVSRNLPAPWGIEEIHAEFFRRLDPVIPTIAYWCHGPTDPLLSEETHHRYGVQLPKHWVETLSNRINLERFVTFGSIHETIPALAEGNRYLAAKRNWFELVPRLSVPIRHFQLHTLYGDPIRARSFVGQIRSALAEQKEFQMSHGLQLREYHHTDDLTGLVVETLDTQISSKAHHLVLSHGRPIQLKTLATGVFEAFSAGRLLKIGAIDTQAREVIDQDWGITPSPFTPPYRDPVAGVTDLISRNLAALSQ